MKFLTEASEGFSQEYKAWRSYYGALQDVLKIVSLMTKQYPGSQRLILEFVTNYIRSTKGATLQILNFVSTIQKEFANLKDEDLVRSLCYHYSGSEGSFTPQVFLEVVTKENFQTKLDDDQKRLILRIISVLNNNGKFVALDDLEKLINLCTEHASKTSFIQLLTEFYTHAPYPSLNQAFQWHDEAVKSGNFAHTMREQYAIFGKTPCPREAENGFKLEQAKNKIKEFSGVRFSIDELQKLANETARVRNESTHGLLKEFKDFKPPPAGSYETLVAIAAELLHRSKGAEGGPGGSPLKLIPHSILLF